MQGGNAVAQGSGGDKGVELGGQVWLMKLLASNQIWRAKQVSTLNLLISLE